MQIFIAALACVFGTAHATMVPPWACPLTNCALKSPLAAAGPGFVDGVRFFSVGSDGKDTRMACPFGDDNDPEPSKAEYTRYMKGLGKTADMTMEKRRKYALEHQREYLDNQWQSELRRVQSNGKINKKDMVDVAQPGVEAVDGKRWSALRNQNEFDFLIAFYAPWCPHCKSFVTSANAPINALSESLEKAGGPKVVKFDIKASDAPASLGLEAVPTIYLFKKSGEAIPFTGDISAANLEGLMAFALGKPAPAKPLAMVAQHSQQQSVPSWACPLTNCVLKSPLASAGPAFPDGVRFFTTGSAGKDTRAACPFGGDDGPEPSKKEYMKYMKAMDKVGDMTSEERRAHAIAHQSEYLADAIAQENKKAKPPSVDVTAPGPEAVNGTTWSQLRNANKFDFLIVLYAPWCPHCKAFVTSENAPIKALSATLEKVNGPKVVSFDIVASTPPMSVESVPTIYRFKTDGTAVEFKLDPHDLEALTAFALDKPASFAQEKKVTQHLRKPAA